MTLTLTRDPRLSGTENMARDVAALLAAEEGRASCRLYEWDGPWVSLGKFQNPETDLLNPGQTQWVIRPTGGKAVLHGHDLTIGLALPLESLATGELSVESLSRKLKTVYTAIARPLTSALRDCGLPVALAADTPFAGQGRKTADCFAHVSPNDIVHERTGVKLCGCALQLTSKAVLVQASIPLGEPISDPASVIRNGQRGAIYRWNHQDFGDALEAKLVKLGCMIA